MVKLSPAKITKPILSCSLPETNCAATSFAASSLSDFVKFAKMRPLPDDNEQVMRYAETFVEETKPEEKAPESENQTSEKTE